MGEQNVLFGHTQDVVDCQTVKPEARLLQQVYDLVLLPLHVSLDDLLALDYMQGAF